MIRLGGVVFVVMATLAFGCVSQNATDRAASVLILDVPHSLTAAGLAAEVGFYKRPSAPEF